MSFKINKKRDYVQTEYFSIKNGVIVEFNSYKAQVDGIEELIIPEGVRMLLIESNEWPKQIKSVVFPTTLKRILAPITAVGSVEVLDFSKTQLRNIPRIEANGRLKIIKLPHTLEELTKDNFRLNVNLQTVYIPSTIDSIGRQFSMANMKFKTIETDDAKKLLEKMNEQLTPSEVNKYTVVEVK